MDVKCETMLDVRRKGGEEERDEAKKTSHLEKGKGEENGLPKREMASGEEGLKNV